MFVSCFVQLVLCGMLYVYIYVHVTVSIRGIVLLAGSVSESLHSVPSSGKYYELVMTSGTPTCDRIGDFASIVEESELISFNCLPSFIA